MRGAHVRKTRSGGIHSASWKARARLARVSTYLLDADSLFANDTPLIISAADPSRAPIAPGVAPTPRRAYVSRDGADTNPGAEVC